MIITLKERTLTHHMQRHHHKPGRRPTASSHRLVTNRLWRHRTERQLSQRDTPRHQEQRTSITLGERRETPDPGQRADAFLHPQGSGRDLVRRTRGRASGDDRHAHPAGPPPVCPPRSSPMRQRNKHSQVKTPVAVLRLPAHPGPSECELHGLFGGVTYPCVDTTTHKTSDRPDRPSHGALEDPCDRPGHPLHGRRIPRGQGAHPGGC